MVRIWFTFKTGCDSLTIPTSQAQVVTSIRSTEETKRINLGFADERKTTIISSSLDDK
jgi:hypothetical protein